MEFRECASCRAAGYPVDDNGRGKPPALELRLRLDSWQRPNDEKSGRRKCATAASHTNHGTGFLSFFAFLT
jgi:hypothetical protein